MAPTSVRRRFGPVGRCIYCGATRYSMDRAKLGKEHIIPEGIGGNLELLEASCFRCEKIINKSERVFQTKMFDPIRYQLGISSKKRPKHKRPTSTPVWFNYSGKEVVRQVSHGELPITVMGLVSLPPGIWTGREKGGGTNSLAGRPIFDGQLKALMEKYGADGVRTATVRAGGPEFFPSMAKIAHSFAVTRYGLDGFHPFLIDVILQRPADFPPNYFIGGLSRDNGPVMVEAAR